MGLARGCVVVAFAAAAFATACGLNFDKYQGGSGSDGSVEDSSGGMPDSPTGDGTGSSSGSGGSSGGSSGSSSGGSSSGPDGSPVDAPSDTMKDVASGP